MSLGSPTGFDQPLMCLFEDPGLPAYRIPQALIELYGGSIGFPELCLYANFVASIEGIVALEQQERSGTVISGGSQADRFVMGLLRACAEAVVVAGGTFRAAPNTGGRPTTSSQGWPTHSSACVVTSNVQHNQRWWWSPPGVTSTRGIPRSKDRCSYCVDGADVLSRAGAAVRLLSLRMHRSYLFLRYHLGEVNDNE